MNFKPPGKVIQPPHKPGPFNASNHPQSFGGGQVGKPSRRVRTAQKNLAARIKDFDLLRTEQKSGRRRPGSLQP